MDLSESLSVVGVALGLGLLVGLQRERADPEHGGFRTFALLTVLGAVCGLLVPTVGPWAAGAGLAGVIACIVVGNAASPKRDPKLINEFTMLVMFAVGLLSAVGPVALAVALGVGVAVLLQAKGRLHGLAARLGDKDMRALLTFLALTFIILPLVPDREVGPYGVLNPRHLWLLVVLVVGIGLAGYVAFKALGSRLGLPLAGVLGGLISSTATTVSYARRAGASGGGVGGAGGAAFVIVLAGTVVYVRVAVEVAAAGPALLPHAAGPIGVMFAASLAGAAVLWLMLGDGDGPMPEQANPAELASALAFAGLFAAVLLLGAWAKATFGEAGLLAVAGLGGLTDMDAVTLSTARLADAGRTTHESGWRAIVVALMSNVAFKAVLAAALGGRALGVRVGAAAAAQLLAGAGVLLLWG